MKISKTGHIDSFNRAAERPEILEVRDRILRKLKAPVIGLGFITALMGAIQVYQQGRLLFAFIYLAIYGLIIPVFILERRIPFSVRAGVLVAGLYAISIAVLIRIGLSGIGLEVLILACLLSAVFWGVKTGLVVVGLSLLAIVGVASGLVSGFLPIREQDMLNSLSPLAWATAGMFFAMMTVGFVFIPQMFLSRLEESLSLLEDKTQHLEASNISLRKEIEARKKAEKAVKEAHTIINRSPAVAFLWKNAEGWPVEFASDNVRDLFGYEVEEFLSGKIPYAQVVHPDDLERLGEEVTRYTKEEGREEFDHEPYRIVTKDGEVKWLDDMTFIRRNEKGEITHYEGIVLDITERMKAEDEKESLQARLQRSQKMESLGLLAGGVAHDLNNILSGIVSYPELLLLDLPEDSKLKKPIETMKDSGNRAAAIVQDLLTVARGVATTKEPLNLNNIVKDYLNSPEFNKLKHFHPTVNIESRLDPNLLNIYGSNVHVRKVLMNLVSNASEAIEGGGRVTISTMNRYVDRPLKGYDNVTMGEYAVLSVSDEGSGIESDDLERIFEPFYTKKVLGRSGTGLGLAVVWNVVQDHDGYIDVKSDESGTTFELYFPITREGIAEEALAVPMEDYKGNGEMILVVDDVESQRDISCKILEKLGYKTEVASSGEEAVEYLKRHTVDLILLDMIMDPGINGREAYERIIEIHPKQKAVIVSGFAETDAVKEAQRLGAGRYVKKPLTLQTLGVAIKEELAKH